jgi:heterodisulfide reductase subunit A-like polyferredoxin
MSTASEERNQDVVNGIVGSVMVVGGGIAGVQASLDLAESGFKVYLVENESAIGGHMAQLDKTFPTNDCSMCIISPKLVDAGSHRNIELLVDSEVSDVRGQVGNFTVRVRNHPRYVDLEKCTGCGDCASVCPVVIPSHFDEGLAEQRAAYKLYPQAVPNAYAIEKLGIAPCRDACPSGQRAQGYIALIREGRFEDALRVIKEDNPFPAICGRICNHRCEEACNRAKLDEAVNIRALKRVVTDRVYAQARVPPAPIEPTHEERVAIIGAGPCGLTAAQDLCRMGYPVTVFETLPVAGGMLRVGVPEYRLPASIIEREVQDIVDLGIDLRLNTRVDNLDDLFNQGFDSVLIAVGAHEGIRLGIPGADLDGVLINTTFLRDVRLGDPPKLGEKVAVIGAGDVAMDVARTAVRMGAEVHTYYRRTREDATADEEEVRHAEEEGVVFHWQVTPTEVVGSEEEGMTGLMCVRTEPGLPDESGRQRPVPVPESEHLVPCDNVIFSVGQRAGLAFVPESTGVGITRWQTIAVNPNTLAATRPGVFAAGDAITGTTFVIEAVESGHRAADSIHRYLRGEELEPEPKPELPVVELSQAEIQERVALGKVEVQPRVPMDELAVNRRTTTFDEVVAGYTDEQAQAEAARCLACGICSECLSCAYTCQADAIDHDAVEQVRDYHVGAIILAPGYKAFDAQLRGEYGYGRYANVVTSLEFERILSASGPTKGHVERPSDGKAPTRVAFIQCVGSRDAANGRGYCSSVCCLYATKQAVIAKEHAADVEPTIFYIDRRAYGKDFDKYLERADSEYGIRYVRHMISLIREDPHTRNLLLKHEGENRQMIEEEFDMVVLSVGIEPAEGTRELADRLGVALNQYGFCKTEPLSPLWTSRPGIFVCGAFSAPKDVPETVMQASGAAAVAGRVLGSARGALVEEKVYPPERDIRGEPPRIGVFVCSCGLNIGGVVRTPDVADYAMTLPNVAYAESNMYTCSQDTKDRIREQIQEHDLNRVIVASCSPRTHEPLFKETLQESGLNRYLFEMANIRDQCSWVHMHEPDAATEKAKDLVRMAVAKARGLTALPMYSQPVTQRGLVVGGGLSGMTAALALAEAGFETYLVEREEELGGKLLNIYYTLDTDNVQGYLTELIHRVHSHPLIRVFTHATIKEIDGSVGNFRTTLDSRNGRREPVVLEHGVVIVATGGVEHKPTAYLHGQDPRVITQLDLEAILEGPGTEEGHSKPTAGDQVVMIQCVESRDAERPYCSRVCCGEAVKNAIKIKETSPNTDVFVLYRDIRTYGFKEDHYRRARELGVVFIPYDVDRKPQVTIADPLQGKGKVGTKDALLVKVVDPITGGDLVLDADLLVLSVAVEPPADNSILAQMLKVPLNDDGFFLEAHAKLRPVDFATEGVFVCGLAHAPKYIEEHIIQANAAASRACTVLTKEAIEVEGTIPWVNIARCTACGLCELTCAYSAVSVQVVDERRGTLAAVVNEALCKGCGACTAGCRSGAIDLQGFSDAQIVAAIDALREPVLAF